MHHGSAWKWMAYAGLMAFTLGGCRNGDAEASGPGPTATDRASGAESADATSEVTTAPSEVESTPAEAADGPYVPTVIAPDPSWPTPPDGMVYIPAADVMLGRANDDVRALGMRHVDAFFIDRFEVTAAAYEACVTTRQCPRYTRPTEVWYGASPTDDPIERWLATACNYGRPERAEHPMNCVSWAEADTFCRARGGALPTFDQREYAGRGPDGRLFPWGNQSPRAGGVYANYKDPSLQRMHAAMGLDLGSYGPLTDDGFPETAPVGSFPRDQSPFGVMDLAGNVSEWTATLGRFGRYHTHPLYGQDVPVLAGQSWITVDSPMMSSQIGDPTVKHPAVGFRCAASIAP